MREKKVKKALAQFGKTGALEFYIYTCVNLCSCLGAFCAITGFDWQYDSWEEKAIRPVAHEKYYAGKREFSNRYCFVRGKDDIVRLGLTSVSVEVGRFVSGCNTYSGAGCACSCCSFERSTLNQPYAVIESLECVLRSSVHDVENTVSARLDFCSITLKDGRTMNVMRTPSGALVLEKNDEMSPLVI